MKQPSPPDAPIRLLVPDMPTADDLLPYLRLMDESKVYVNHGSLVCGVEKQFDGVAVSNGTLALELALRAMALPKGSKVMVPAVTFAASGLAIINAGLTPLIVDVDPHTWQLTSAIAREAMTPDCKAVLPVAAFGMPVRVAPWEALAEEFGVKVLVDAAGAVTVQDRSTHPSLAFAFSFHATKFIGAGEGGLVASANRLWLESVDSMAAFGNGGTNAKMSEYHAAVCLASTARVIQKRQRLRDVAEAYLNWLPSSLVLQRQTARPEYTLFNVLLPAHTTAAKAQAHLSAYFVETKQWYRPFLDERRDFMKYPKYLYTDSTTMRLRDRLLGLPFHAFMTADDVRRVCSTLVYTL